MGFRRAAQLTRVFGDEFLRQFRKLDETDRGFWDSRRCSSGMILLQIKVSVKVKEKFLD